jgi:hypothetical protein
MAVAIDRLVPLPRNQGIQIPDVVNASRWVDSLALSAGTAKSYTLRTDASGNKARILRVCTSAGPVYYNCFATAVIPTTDTTDGSSATQLAGLNGGTFISAPVGCTAISFICAGACIVTIESWA